MTLISQRRNLQDGDGVQLPKVSRPMAHETLPGGTNHERPERGQARAT